VFERFTEEARQVIVLAQEEAGGLRHNYIGTEHLLLGLVGQERGLPAEAFESFDITAGAVRAQVARIVGHGDEATTGHIPFTPRSKRVLEGALREALSLGDNYIGSQHLLLALLREGDGVAERILADFDAAPDRIWADVMKRLGKEELYTPAPRTRESVIRFGSDESVVRFEEPNWSATELLSQFWFGMVIGAALLAIGIFLGWLIWG
jgi:ATP-dependent Clp protease ATP-binding subunit ClpA